MIRYNKRIMKEGKCAVCNSPVMVDEGGNGDVLIKDLWGKIGNFDCLN